MSVRDFPILKMKTTLFLLALIASSFSLQAQDIIVLKNEVIDNVKVLEVTPSEVKYKKSSNSDSLIFSEKRSDIQMIKYQNGDVRTFKDSRYRELIAKKKFTHEADLYIGAGWGVGYQLRREFNQYVGWNIIGISYMNDFSSLSEVALINLKLAGVRGYTPSYKWFRGYADLCLGYSYAHDWGDHTHYIGADLNLGVQLHKNFALGLDLIYCAPNPFAYVGARFSYLF